MKKILRLFELAVSDDETKCDTSCIFYDPCDPAGDFAVCRSLIDLTSEPDPAHFYIIDGKRTDACLALNAEIPEHAKQPTIEGGRWP